MEDYFARVKRAEEYIIRKCAEKEKKECIKMVILVSVGISIAIITIVFKMLFGG